MVLVKRDSPCLDPALKDHRIINKQSRESKMSSLTKGKDREKEKKLSMYKLAPYKTELRRGVIAKRRELTRLHLLDPDRSHERRPGKRSMRNVVTIDTSKARGSIDVVRLVIRDLGWREYPFQRRGSNCDVMWHALSFQDQAEIYSGQVNKFPGTLEIFQKVNLFRWLEFMKNLYPDDYNFFPRTWLLPHQYHEFSTEVRSMNEKKTKNRPMFIVKPSDGSQGEGIFLLRDPQQYVSNGRTHVVQEYLSDVFLIDKFKFDLRVYVVLRSLEPLQFYICQDGLARFSTLAYEQPTNKNMHETYMHLTNYSLNKKSSDFKNSDRDDEGSKRKMSAVLKQIERMGYDTRELWTKIEQLVTKTLIAVAGELKVEYQSAIPSGKPGPTCFQILGFDILLLKNLEPYLLEVNSNPSLNILEEHETSLGEVEYGVSRKDEDVKRSLIRDTLLLIAPKNKYTCKRRRRRRWVQCYNGEEEDMDIANLNGFYTRRNRREKVITIKYVDLDDEKPVPLRSIFEEAGYYGKRKDVLNGTSRTSLEGEGGVTLSHKGPSDFPENQKQENLPDFQNSHIGNKNDKMHRNRPDNDVCLTDTHERLRSDAEEEEEEEEMEESSLKEIFPGMCSDEFEDTRITERLADIFITCLGVKGCLRLGPSMFRLFARKCRLCRKGITNAAIDILYIDMQRKWDYMNPARTSGLNFSAFVSSCLKIAIATFDGSTRTVQLDNFIDHCQIFLKMPADLETPAARRTIVSKHNLYSHVWSRNDLEDEEEDVRLLRLPPAEMRPRQRTDDGYPYVTTGTANSSTKDFSSSPYRRHRNIFHLLQSLKK